MPTNDRELIEKAITFDLFGLDQPVDEDEPAVPDKYALVRPIGQGAFGSVWLAHDLALDRDVALKFLKGARPADLERFRREARFTARLDGRGIVRVFELGEHEGASFIAMQYVDGGSLAEADLDRQELLRVARDTAHALGRAHEEGIVHRDIKPENILLDEQTRPFITDFGIARDLSGSAGLTLSHDGAIMGTPAFMAPEQARGEVDKIDARSDVYSLGATLYYKLTGRVPFKGSNLAAVLHAVVYEESVLPRAFDPGIPQGAEDLVMRCLRKDPGARFQSMDAFATAIEDQLRPTSTPATAPNAWFRRLVGKEDRPPASPSTRDPLKEEIAREIYAADADLYRSSSVARCFARLDAVITRLDRMVTERPDVPWTRFYRGMAHARRDCLDQALDDMERSVDRLGEIATTHFELGRLYLTLYLRELQIARSHVMPEGAVGHLDAVKGRLGQAAVAFGEAARIQGGLEPWQIQFVKAVGQLSEGRLDRCIAACDKLLEAEPDLEEVWKLKGDAHALSGGDPISCYDRALEIRRTYYDACYAKAESLVRQGRSQEARETLAHAVEIHPSFADAYAFLGRLCLESWRSEEDIARLHESLQALDRAVQAHDRHYEAWVLRAEVLLELGQEDAARLDEAVAAAERARKLPGCLNRAQIAHARALLARTRAGGGDRDTDLRRVLEYRHGFTGDMQPEMSHTPWPAIWEEAERLLDG